MKLLRDMKSEGTRLDGRLYRSSMNALRDSGLQVEAKWLQKYFAKMFKRYIYIYIYILIASLINSVYQIKFLLYDIAFYHWNQMNCYKTLFYFVLR